MIQVRPAASRGSTFLNWLSSQHTFSFNRYIDRNHMGFRSLRVINDDVVAPGGGFGTHPHQDMEILTWVLSGNLVHQDSTGSSGVIRPGDAQKMSAGTGIYHSEVNGSQTEPVHLYQIWVLPEREGIAPYYEQIHFPESDRKNRLRLIASRDARDGSIRIHQDADVHNAVLDLNTGVEHPLAPGRHAWLQVARGSIDLNGNTLKTGDGAAISGESLISIKALTPAEVLLFDLA